MALEQTMNECEQHWIYYDCTLWMGKEIRKADFKLPKKKKTKEKNSKNDSLLEVMKPPPALTVKDRLRRTVQYDSVK